MSLTKLEVARAQLATALDLFIRDRCPISVQCLACGGGEVIEQLAELEGVVSFATTILQNRRDLDDRQLRSIRNQFWNAFKHLTARDGSLRQDDEVLATFNDAQNDAALFVGWHDYMKVAKRLPIEAQVFQVWWYALYEDKLARVTDVDPHRVIFPGLQELDRREQKRRLGRASEKWRLNKDLLSDPATEKHLLMR